MITKHRAMDVPRLTRFVTPEEHAGKLIMTVSIRLDRWELPRAIFTTDTGESIQLHAHEMVEVEQGPERAARLIWARAVVSGALPASLDAGSPS